MTFYKLLKYDFEEIQRLVDETFHSKAQYKESDQFYVSQLKDITNPVACARSVWIQSNMSLGNMIGVVLLTKGAGAVH